MNFSFDITTQSLKKFGEQLCGDCCLVSSSEMINRVLIVDGLGSGLTANLHATMMAKIIMSFAEKYSNIEKLMSYAMQNITTDNTRNTQYNTFIYLQIQSNGNLEIINYNMPKPILFHYGEHKEIDLKKISIGNKVVELYKDNIKTNDTIVIMSDGVVKAGIGASLNLGIGHKNVVKYLENSYKPQNNSKRISELLLNVCNSLYLEKPGDDCTIAVIKANLSKTKKRNQDAVQNLDTENL